MRLAAIFADDILSLGGEALARFGAGASAVTIPITIPVDRAGLVVVSAAPPELADPDSRRQPATLALARTADGLNVALAFEDNRPMRLPGVHALEGARGEPAELARVSFEVTAAGFLVTAAGADGAPIGLGLDEATARQLATALLLTFRVKMIGADRRGGSVATPTPTSP